MDVHWEQKKERPGGMSNTTINEWYELARENGALGGKLIGAGGGRFLMFYTEDKTRLRRAMRNEGLREVRFRFDSKARNSSPRTDLAHAMNPPVDIPRILVGGLATRLRPVTETIPESRSYPLTVSRLSLTNCGSLNAGVSNKSCYAWAI